MHYWGYVMEQLLGERERRFTEGRRGEVRRRRGGATGDRRWTRAAPRD
jgi:hypothetical protein